MSQYEVTTTKIDRGHYKLSRNDGYSIVVRKSAGKGWYDVSTMHREPTLAAFQFDMSNGYMAVDLVARHLDPDADKELRAWEKCR